MKFPIEIYSFCNKIKNVVAMQHDGSATFQSYLQTETFSARFGRISTNFLKKSWPFMRA